MAGETLDVLDLRIPYKMNTDLAPHLLAEDEAQLIRNTVPGEPGQVRPRYGMQGYSAFADPTSLDFGAPINVLVHGNNLAIVKANSTGLTTHIPYYTYWPGFNSPALGAEYTIHSFAAFPPSPATVTGSGVTAPVLPYGKTVYADNTVVGASYLRGARDTKATFPAGNYGAVTRWGGGTAPDVTLTGAVTNGSRVVTLSATHANSLTGMMMRVAATAAPYDYQYRVAAHTAGTATVTLDRAYGLGESAANVPSNAAASVRFEKFVYIPNSPIDAACVGIYKDRVFAGRGWVNPAVTLADGTALSGYYNTVVQWSEPGNPEKWPDSNVIVLDEDVNNPVMGFASLPNKLVIFLRDKTYVMSGTDEDSFTWDVLHDNLGCVFSSSITNYEDSVIWVSKHGVHMYNGYETIELSRLGASTGIRRALMSELDTGSSVTVGYKLYPWRIVTCEVIKPNRLLVLIYDTRVNSSPTVHDGWMFDFKTGGWSRWGSDDDNLQPRMVTRINDYIIGVGKYQLFDITNCWRDESESDLETDFLDEGYDTTNTPITKLYNSEIVFRDVMPYPGWTVGLRDVQVHHNQQQSTDPDPAFAAFFRGWTVYTAVDPNLEDADEGVATAKVGEVTVRYDTDKNMSRMYTDRFVGTVFPLRGAVFRVRLYTPGTGTEYTRPPLCRVSGVYLTMDRDRQLRVDNPVVSS